MKNFKDFLVGSQWKITEAKVATEPKWPDTKQGAIDCIKKIAKPSLVKELDLPNCKVFPDPSVHGIWGIENKAKKKAVIIYMAGYKIEGRIQPYDDFEENTLMQRYK